MEYNAELWRKMKPEKLYQGQVRGFDVVIVNMGSHPCAYIALDEGHPLTEKLKDTEAGYDVLDLPVHGGLTFSGYGNGIFLDDKTFWIGWDYAHTGDYIDMGLVGEAMKLMADRNAKRWTTEEIYNEIEGTIPYLIRELTEHEKE